MKTLRVSPAIESRLAARRALAEALQRGVALQEAEARALVEPCEFLSEAEATGAFKRLVERAS